MAHAPPIPFYRDVPALDASASPQDIERLAARTKLVFISSGASRRGDSGDREAACLAALQTYVSSEGATVAAGWTAETSDGVTAALAAPSKEPWYASFVLEGPSGLRLLAAFPEADSASVRWPPTGVTWGFFGRNPGGTPLLGKPEHVDELRPGIFTMHAQLCGAKTWRLRPNAAAESWGAGGAPATGYVEVVCSAGDLLLLDTAAWYHETALPAATRFSLSVARDFSTDGPPRVSSVLRTVTRQQMVTRQICAQCGTPTLPPRGWPEGTCGCACCTAKREERREWEAFWRSAMLLRKASVSFLQELFAMIVAAHGPRLAIRDK